jgi:hypothetical protein
MGNKIVNQTEAYAYPRTFNIALDKLKEYDEQAQQRKTDRSSEVPHGRYGITRCCPYDGSFSHHHTKAVA